MPMTDIVGFLGCELMIQRVHGVGKDHRRLIQEKERQAIDPAHSPAAVAYYGVPLGYAQPGTIHFLTLASILESREHDSAGRLIE
jgi:hypothetical protein